MSRFRPVLVLAGTSRVVQAVARCLYRRGIVVDVAYPQALGTVNFSSRAVRNVYRLPDFNPTPDFYGPLDDLVSNNSYDTLIPTTDEALVAISPFYDQLRLKLYPGCPAPQIVNSVLDKRLTLKAAGECGIDVPREYQLRSLEDLDNHRDTLRFPLLAKPASKVEEVNFALKYFHNFDQLRQAFLEQPSFGSKHLLQEYCPGFGVGIELLIWAGKVRVVFQHRRLKELPSTGGVSVLAEAQLPDQKLVDVATRLLERLKWQGVAMVEFRYDPATSRAALMEVNGRYWGSLPLSVNAGVEFPYYEWQLAHGEEPAAVTGYRAGFRTLWRTGDLIRFTTLLVRLKSGAESFRTVWKEGCRLLTDFFSLTPDALWQWRDPWPAAREFRDRILQPVFRPRTLLRLMPEALARQCTTYRYYGLRYGLRHSYIAASYGLHARKRDVKSSLRTATSFLFVCSGNIIRSPMAALLLKQRCDNPHARIESAGLFARTGNHADPTAVIAARELGVSLDDHRSTLLSAELVEQNDVIFVMDHLNEAILLTRFPQAARKTFLLGSCVAAANGNAPKEIADPFGRGLDEIRKCYGEVQGCVQTLNMWLSRPPV